MTKRTRTVLFLLLGLMFIGGVPLLLFYSQGYRLDLDQGRISQVGAFYFDVSPPRAQVLLDGKLIGRTAPLLGTILTKNLLSGVYTIQIRKEGYHAWEKRLEIAPKQVTEAKRIVLLPQNLAWNAVQENVGEVWLAPNKTVALLQRFSDSQTWTLSLWNIQTSTDYLLYASDSQEILENLRWADDSNSFIATLQTQGERAGFLQHVDNSFFARPHTAEESLQAAAQIREPYIPPETNNDSAPSDQNPELEELLAVFPEVVLSPDQRKIAYSDGREIWVRFVREEREQPARAQGEHVFLTRFSEQVSNIAWVTPHYLLFSKGETIAVSEIDTRDRLNIAELGSFPNPRVFWLEPSKTLLLHSNSRLYLSAKLLL